MLMKTFVSVLFFFVMVGGALQSCIGEKERVESSASIGVGDSVPKFDIGTLRESGGFLRYGMFRLSTVFTRISETCDESSFAGESC